jgi:hypothetical protein
MHISGMASKFADPLRRPPLDNQLYFLSLDALDFFKSQTGIEDEDSLREHILTVQKKAYEVGRPDLSTNQQTFNRHPDLRLPMHPQLFVHEVRHVIFPYSHY